MSETRSRDGEAPAVSIVESVGSKAMARSSYRFLLGLHLFRGYRRGCHIYGEPEQLAQLSARNSIPDRKVTP